MKNRRIDRETTFNAYSADSASIYFKIQLSYMNGYAICQESTNV